MSIDFEYVYSDGRVLKTPPDCSIYAEKYYYLDAAPGHVLRNRKTGVYSYHIYVRDYNLDLWEEIPDSFN